jgi:TMEM175 potassium channel family protein
MSKGRLEAFSDAVIAILLTIMVLELKAPHEGTLDALRPLWPVLTSYVLSFIYLGIYWNNHHHLLQAVRHVNGRILWANLHLLFWLSLVPFGTAWMGDSHFAPMAVAAYGVPLLLAGVAYYILERALIAHDPHDSTLAAAVGSDVKGLASILVYAIAIPLAFAAPWLSCVLYAAVAMWWLVPDRRIERALATRS